MKAVARYSKIRPFAGAADLPPFVKDAFDALLECGILARGFEGHTKMLDSQSLATCRSSGRLMLN
jgi:hypothetical protein